MLKLKRFLKPYLALLLGAVVLLFGQAMLELELPNLMSDIVNTGIQKGGITHPAPGAISAEAMGLMQTFMSGEDRDAVAVAYAPAEADAAGMGEVGEAYPALKAGDLVLRDKEPSPEADKAFARASYAMMQLMEDMVRQSGQDVALGDAESKTLDLSKLEQVLPMLAQIPPETIAEKIEMASATDDTILDQTAAVFTKSFYVQLGADTDAMQTNYILITGAKMLGFAVLLTLCAVGAGFCLSRMGAGVGRDLRHAVFTKVTGFNNAELDQFSTASLITRSTNDVMQVQGFLSMGLRMLIFAPVMGVGSLVMSLRRSASMSWILLGALVIMLAVIFTLFGVALPRFKKMQDLIDRLNLVAREELSGMMVVRAFANQDFMQKRFDSANKDLTGNTLFTSRAMSTMMPIMTLVMNGVSLLIVWVGGHQIAASTMQVGDMMAFIQYAMHVIMSFLFISMMFVMVPRASVSAGRINQVLETEDSVKDPAQPKQLSGPVKGVVEFKDVSFSYSGASEKVLEHVSFKAEPGKTTAFIGSTGSGKSTLINLIPRFYDATEGAVTLDGVNVKDLSQHQLRDAIGYVPQKGMLFSGTLASNLRYGDEEAGDETLRTAADIAQATEFIDHLDEGYDTPISQGGTNVSGGQRQRLSIARALVKKAPIYIFDDTFSALDFKTDAKLRQALAGYTRHSTVFIVAQRVSTIMHADQIVVLNEGKVMGIGTHEELLKNCTTYREIAESQLSKEELA